MDGVFSVIAMILIILFLLAACVFVYMTTPGKFRWFDMPAAYCHRGYHNEIFPENSLGAFKNAAEHGLGVELDVHMTKDGEIVVFHDSSLKRMCGVDKKIGECTYEELSAFHLGSSEEKIPLFSDVLKTCGGVPVSCEIKAENMDPSVDETYLSKVYEIIKDYPGDWNVISFHPYVLKWFREHHPEVIRGFLSMDYSKEKNLKIPATLSFMLSHLLFNYVAKPDFITFRFGDKTFGWKLCRFYGTRLCAWVIRSMDEVETAAYDGVSTFVCEDFDVTEV